MQAKCKFFFKKSRSGLFSQLLIGVYALLWTHVFGLGFSGFGKGWWWYFWQLSVLEEVSMKQQTKAGQAGGLRLCFACLILLFVFPP